MSRTRDWAAVRRRYVSGDESFAAIAADLGVSKRAVQLHAVDREANDGRTWVEMRETFRRGVADDAEEITARLKAAASATVAMEHVRILGEMAKAASALVVDALRACEPKDFVKFTLAIIALERRVHGLDNTRIEVTGKDGGAIEHDIDLTIDEETQARVQRALEAFGADPPAVTSSGDDVQKLRVVA